MDISTLYPMLGALLGSLVTGGCMFLAQRTAQREERRRQVREIAANLAIAEWGRHFDRLKIADAAGRKVKYRPIDEYFLAYLPPVAAMLGEAFEDETDVIHLAARLNRADRIIDGIMRRRLFRYHSTSGTVADFIGGQEEQPPKG